MAKVNLTDRAVRAAKADPGQRLELWDAACKGLCLRISDGGKTWVFRYRTPDGRQPRVKLGDFSDTFGLAEARTRANRLKLAVADGKDPAGEARRARATAKAEPIKTFNDLADAFLKASESGDWKPKGRQKSARTIADERGVLKRHVRPALGAHRPADIDRRTVRNFLQKMKGLGIGAQTTKAHATIRQCFAYAISEELASIVANPAVGFSAPVSINARSRVLSDEELRKLWGGLVDCSGLRSPLGEKVTVGRPVRIALQLACLLLQRRGEIAGMMASEIDLEAATWEIPPERMKNRRPHLVPLPAHAVGLIREALQLAALSQDPKTPANQRPVFPSPRDPHRPVKADSITHACAEITSALGLVDVTPHDLRRTGSTGMTSERLGISHFIRSKVLSHSDSGGGSAVSMAHYDLNTYAGEKRRALEAWERLLLATVEGRNMPSSVTPISSAREAQRAT